MSKTITIDELIPLLKSGYVSMDIEGEWWYHSQKPVCFETDGRFFVTGYKNGHSWLLQEVFNIKKFKGDWKDSLIKVEHKKEE